MIVNHPCSPNHDRCGRCGQRHPGNSHLCRVHGPVAAGCCDTPGIHCERIAPFVVGQRPVFREVENGAS